MHAAVIENGVVVNLIVVDSLDALPDLIDGEGAAIGDLWDGTQFVKPEPPPPNLAELRAAKNEAINSWRAAANQSVFSHAEKKIACDQLSRSDIDGVANHISLFGTFPDGFPGGWKATDNTMIPLLDIDSFRALYASMTAQGTANFNHAQDLKAALAAATTPDEIEAITW